MELKEIKKILKLMEDHGLAEFTLENGDTKLIVKSQAGVAPALVMPQAVAPASVVTAATAPAAVDSESAPEDTQVITSPMIGTFYSAANPDSDTYVSIGSNVVADSTVCIIEAMKIMNEIKAEITGTIVELCVSNGQTVEFGQPLFKVKSN